MQVYTPSPLIGKLYFFFGGGGGVIYKKVVSFKFFDKYTWAPQTVHNTPVVNILKGYFCV